MKLYKKFKFRSLFEMLSYVNYLQKYIYNVFGSIYNTLFVFNSFDRPRQLEN